MRMFNQIELKKHNATWSGIPLELYLFQSNVVQKNGESNFDEINLF